MSPTTCTATISNGGYITGTVPSTHMTVSGTGTGYSANAGQYLTITGGSGGGSGQILTTNNAITSPLVWANTTANNVAIRVTSKGDIFQGDTTHDNDGVFARLARLERLMGIMQRDHTLERDYEPMRELGESYDDAIDAAIQQIMDAALHQLKHMEDEYDSMREQAKVWRALSKDD